MEYIAIVIIVVAGTVSMALRERTHSNRYKEWAEERRQLVDRIMAVDYVAYKTIKPKPKVAPTAEEAKPKPPEFV